MKIQWLGNDHFVLKNKEVSIDINPSKVQPDNTFSVFSTPGTNLDQSSNKAFNLPGEFEVSGILAQGYHSDDAQNIVYKIVMEGSGIIAFGALKSMPKTDFFESLGENTDIIILNLSSDFDDKLAKKLIQQVTPRLAILGGDKQYFPAMVENANAKTAEANPYAVKALSDENTEVLILPA